MNTRAFAYSVLTKGISRILRTPLYLILFVTDKCWLKCRHCWFNEDWKLTHAEGKALSFDELEKISSGMHHIYFLSLTGGEAFLRDDIADISELFVKNNKLGRLQIPTSGFDTDIVIGKTREILNRIKIPFRVDVSLDGDEETHDYIRQVDKSFSSAVETIRELNILKRHCGNFDVGIITTVSRYNQNQLDYISGMVEKIHHDGEWMINITRGNPRDAKSRTVDIKKYSRASELINNRIIQKSYHGHSGHLTAKWLTAKNNVRRQVIKEILEGKKRGGGCSAGALIAVITHDGAVYPCELYDENFGNLRENGYDFLALWNSPRAVKIREKIQYDECSCTQECFLSMNLLMQPSAWRKIVRERIKLYKYNR